MLCVLWSDFARGSYNVVIGTDGFEVAATAADFLGFGVAELLEILGGFGFPHEVEDGVVVFENCPVGVVGAEGCFDFEPVRQFKKKLYVGAPIERFGELALDFRLANDGIVNGFLNLKAVVQVDLWVPARHPHLPLELDHAASLIQPPYRRLQLLR